VRANPRQFDRLYRAFRRGDHRFDGRAFVAVRTTGIYCLLSCRARKPKRRNIDFYFSRAAAEREGFRPCRKCRPELSGGRRAQEQAALGHWLNRLAEEDTRIGEAARSAGATPSRLYRMFRRHLGKGPREARARARLRRACALLRLPDRSITEVAYDAGFGSLATFYRWFRSGVGVTPVRFRALCGISRNGENPVKNNSENAIARTTLETPIGVLEIETTSRGVCRIDFRARRAGEKPPSRPVPREAKQHLDRAVRQLREYFAGRRNEFDVPLDLEGTRHQQRVWQALLDIPFGRTLSYGEVASQLGIPRASRAVGRACATNPVPVVVPCHRVLGGDAKLHGYGGGLWRKRVLLEHEGVLTPKLPH